MERRKEDGVGGQVFFFVQDAGFIPERNTVVVNPTSHLALGVIMCGFLNRGHSLRPGQGQLLVVVVIGGGGD